MRRALFLLACLGACAAAPKGEQAEAPPSLRTEFVGNKSVRSRDLEAAARRELRAFAERGRRPADAADAAYAMEQLLRERGHPDGTVGFEMREDRLVFVVQEGTLFRLGDVRFQGATTYDENRLRALFDFGGKRPPFNGAAVDAAASEIESFYLLQGHLRARVRAEVEFDAQAAIAKVAFLVEEGQRFEVTGVELAGVTLAELGIEKLDLVGRPYHVRVPVEAAARVRAVLLGRGHQFAAVNAEAEVNEDTGAAIVHIRAEPGPRARLRKLRILGNERTRERFLRRRVLVRETEIVVQQLLDASIDNLYRTGLFSAVRPRLERVGKDEVDLEVTLKEVEARSVDFEVGYGSYELARGAVRFRDNNIFGIGRRFEAELRGSVRSAGVSFFFQNPYIFGERTTLDIDTGFLVREEPSFDRQAIDFDIVLSHRLANKAYRLRGGYRFRSEEATDVTGEIAPAEAEGFVRSAGLIGSIRRDTRDSLVLPTAGSVTQAAFFWSAPALGAQLNFVEIDLRHSQYVRVSERAVLAFGVFFQSRPILDDRLTLPIQERLFLGGESTVRSFFKDELGPFNVGGDPLGGLTSTWANVELRYRLWRQLYGAVFYDVGLVDTRSLSVQGPPGHALGIGFRYQLPIGPIRLDFAYNPGRLFAADQEWAIHLAVGFSF